MLAPDIDPVAIQIGPLKIHWYGLMYLIGFVGAWWLRWMPVLAPVMLLFETNASSL